MKVKISLICCFLFTLTACSPIDSKQLTKLPAGSNKEAALREHSPVQTLNGKDASNETLGQATALAEEHVKNVANWTVSCKPVLTPYSFKKIPPDGFQFTLEKGDQGNCSHDHKDYWEGTKKIFDFSERQEILSFLPGDGDYRFSAEVHVENSSGPALRSTIFQVHDQGKGDARHPPATFLGVNDQGRFRLSRCNTARGPKAKSCKTSGIWLQRVPKEPFQLLVKFKIKDKKLWADYYVNGSLLVSAENTIWSRPMVKIGIYRINARGKTVQTYRNVSLVKVLPRDRTN